MTVTLDILWYIVRHEELNNLRILDVQFRRVSICFHMSWIRPTVRGPPIALRNHHHDHKPDSQETTSLGCGRCANWYGQLNASAAKLGRSFIKHIAGSQPKTMESSMWLAKKTKYKLSWLSHQHRNPTQSFSGVEEVLRPSTPLQWIGYQQYESIQSWRLIIVYSRSPCT